MSLAAPKAPLTDFFVALGEDHAALAEYERDPQAFLERSGLDHDAIAALLTGDLQLVHDAVAGDRAEYDEHVPPEHTPGEHTTPEHAPAEHDPPEHTPAEHDPPEHTPDDEPALEHAPDE
jgi:hypothetical protein